MLIARPSVLVSGLAAGYLLVAARQVNLRGRAASLPPAAQRELIAVLDGLEHAAHSYRVPVADLRKHEPPTTETEAPLLTAAGAPPTPRAPPR
jgi:hypothetical protein